MGHGGDASSHVCSTCGELGWKTWDDAAAHRRDVLAQWRRSNPTGPAPAVSIRSCDNDGHYHLDKKRVTNGTNLRVERCPVCGLFAWHQEGTTPKCRTACYRPNAPVPQFWWRSLLNPQSGLIRQPPALRRALFPLEDNAHDELMRAAGQIDALAAVFLDGVGKCLQLVVASNAGDLTRVREISLSVDVGHDPAARHNMWRYAALMQGLAAGRLPLRPYWDVHALLHQVAVPATASMLLRRVQVNSTLPFVWQLVGAVL
ncbi:hypothetical protein [Lentzea sp. NBRC 102530]|uniref:hypothetical protein n=1 Tax=Lentzea sp. NBRC 102530 TaxID=3032201 RepID=UPI00249FB1DC|nr:hypothetical protein [Lentzea sp. NBRC 102530]GLY54805.1 hypothetical protein Lesp01_84600 [Lentzea sp. NBRC 102530]